MANSKPEDTPRARRRAWDDHIRSCARCTGEILGPGCVTEQRLWAAYREIAADWTEARS